MANTFLGNSDEDTPQGSVRYTVKSTYSWQEDTRDSNGVVTGYITRNIPRFLKVTSLTPKSQDIFDKQQSSQSEMMDWVLLQTQSMKRVMSQPFTLTGLPARGAAPELQSLRGDLPTPGIIRARIGADANSEAVRQRALDALASRTDFLMGRDRQAMIVKLRNQGIVPGMRAYFMEMQVFDQSLNDARTRDYLAAGQEASRVFGIDQASAAFENQAQQQAFTQSVIATELYNKTAMQKFTMLHQIGDFLNVLRERALQERVTERSVPVNEITSIMHGGQVSMPKFADFKGGHVSDTPVGQYVYQSAALDMQKWQVQTDYQQKMTAGIMDMAGKVGGAMMMGSDRRIKRDIVALADDVRGFTWYAFRYVWGGPLTVGVMAQEVGHIPGAVHEFDGVLAVDYAALLNG